MKLLMILVLTFYGCLLLAEERKVGTFVVPDPEQKVCGITQVPDRYKKINPEKIRQSLITNNCKIHDILYIRGQNPRFIMAMAAHACIIETIKAPATSFIICEYRGLVRDARNSENNYINRN